MGSEIDASIAARTLASLLRSGEVSEREMVSMAGSLLRQQNPHLDVPEAVCMYSMVLGYTLGAAQMINAHSGDDRHP
jgi:hypothetical protein